MSDRAKIDRNYYDLTVFVYSIWQAPLQPLDIEVLFWR